MQSLHETRKRILELAEPTEAIEVPLSEAVGLVLAEPHFADVDLPSFDRSAVGGYALRSTDAAPGRSLRLLDNRELVPSAIPSVVPLSRRTEPAQSESDDDGRDFSFGFGFEAEFDDAALANDDLHLFSPFDLDDHDDDEAVDETKTGDDGTDNFDFGVEIGPDEALWVDPGDPMPIGADAVAEPDEVQTEPGLGGGFPRAIALINKIDAGQNVVVRGHFLRAGTELDRAGVRLRPSMVGLLAAQGCVHPVCHRRVRVAVLAVGDQLVSPGEAPILHRERNAAGLTVAIPCIQWGAMVHDLGTVPFADLDRALYRATTAPVVLVMGPNSVAISDALARAGLDVRASGVALDPCEDVTYGVIRGESGRVESHLFRLSPSPVAALVAATLLVGPLVARLQGEAPADPPRRRYAVWNGAQNATDHRTRAVPVKLVAGDDARLQAMPISYRGVDDLAGFSRADALVLFPPHSGPWTGGDIVEVVPIGQALHATG